MVWWTGAVRAKDKFRAGSRTEAGDSDRLVTPAKEQLALISNCGFHVLLWLRFILSIERNAGVIFGPKGESRAVHPFIHSGKAARRVRLDRLWRKLVSAAGFAPAVAPSQTEHVAATPRAVCPDANSEGRRGLVFVGSESLRPWTGDSRGDRMDLLDYVSIYSASDRSQKPDRNDGRRTDLFVSPGGGQAAVRNLKMKSRLRRYTFGTRKELRQRADTAWRSF